jgi:hypothetical protein
VKLQVSITDLRQALHSIRDQAFGTLSRVVLAVFTFGSPAIVSAVAPSALSLYAAVDVIFKAALNATAVLPQAFVAWVGVIDPGIRRRRMIRSVGLVAVASISSFVLWWVAGGSILDIVFSSKIDFHENIVILLGGAISITLLVRGIETLVYVPLSKARTVYRVSTLGSLFGIPLTVLLVGVSGAAGVLVAWIITHLLLLLSYLVLLVRLGKDDTRPEA